MQALHTQTEAPQRVEIQFPSDDVLRVEGNKWRQYGIARRKELLEKDQERGGTIFKLKASCSVHRYTQVAHRALQQFHKMYASGSHCEEAYVMGHRMISFLTESLPKHPGFRLEEVSELQIDIEHELQLLKECLDDIAIQIDEEQCDQYVADFDPILDDSSADESLSESSSTNWTAFEGWADSEQKIRSKRTYSPTSETVATSGSGSVDPFDLSSSYDSGETERLRVLDSSNSGETSPRRVYTMETGTEFLDRIAREDVHYENDSDAADSWAQDNDSIDIDPSTSSASGITCDPARLAFRELLKVSQLKESPERTNQRNSQDSMYPYDDTICPYDERAVEIEIQNYLNSDEGDPTKVFESSMEKLKSPSRTRFIMK